MSSVIEEISKIYVSTNDGAMFTFPKDFVAFNGHFPQQPLLPAIVQIELAIFTISKKLNKDVKLKTVKKAKFLSPIFPQDTINLIVIDKDNNNFDVTIKKEENILSSFQIVLE